MAIILGSSPKFVIQTQDTFVLGDADDAFVGTYQVHVVADDDWDGSVTVMARSRQQYAAQDNIPFVEWNYLNTYVNGAVGDQTYVNTAITGTSCILIPASGVQIALDCTSYTDGTLTAYITPLMGAAA